MAVLNVNFFSQALMRPVTVNVILPIDKYSMEGKSLNDKKKFKTLYLLHGIYGDQNDWISGTRIASWAMEKNLAVVMPAGENHFYVDKDGYGARHGEFVGKELVEATRAMFPLSHNKKDTFIGGLSMGGYGAMINGLKYNETFGSIIALSAGLHLDDIINSKNDVRGILGRRDYYESVFGDLNKIKGSDKDYFALLEKLIAEKTDIPKIYMACGTEDFLVEHNRAFAEFLKQKNVEYTYEESKGAHTWMFWDEYIYKALCWLPLEDSTEGISSGNVL